VKYFGALMALIYFAAGFFILTRGSEFNFISQYRIPFGFLMFAYGAFRGYSVYKKFKEDE
jgi:hypothetical protein